MNGLGFTIYIELEFVNSKLFFMLGKINKSELNGVKSNFYTIC